MERNDTKRNLRNGKVLIIKPASKSLEEYRNTIKCPPLLLRKVKNHKYYGSGAQPMGKNGKLSRRYNRDSMVKYIHQLFYEKEKLGEGSFGVVYACQSLEDSHTYAIKILQKEKEGNEIRNLDIVNGVPHCIQYHNAWLEDGLVYIQLELGVMSLAEYADKNHNICEEECWNILHDIAKALAALHELGYCHMDIKPENIVITPDGKYKLCDFGLLHNVNQKKKRVISSEGDAKYIASEILQGNITTAGDIFSLGITIMEIAFDLLLPTNGQLWQDIRNCDWRTLPKGESRRVSIDMENTINWMMCSRPEQRPSSAQVLQLLGAYLKRARSKKTRFNYFGAWYDQYDAQKEEDPSTKVVINGDLTLDSTILESDLSIEDDNIRTPPRRISSVIIYQKA